MLNRLLFSLSLKRFACLFIIAAFAITTSAQTHKQPYTLLWRISGKDLKEPSYLFGTMHVKDKRVFGFSDSVMLAIKKCKSFALEIHPDSTVKMLFDFLGNRDTSWDLHKMLTKGEYEKLSKKFEARNGYKMRDNMNPVLAETMMEPEHSKPDDKESFVDAYLYGIARSMHKSMYGLENISYQLNKAFGSKDQIKQRLLGLLENGGDEMNNSEQLIKIYSTGNLQNIQKYINQHAPADSELIARNKVMATGIIKHAREAPIFVAVGAAHLPGDDGVIALLRNEGYTVEPVTATFTGVASKFHIDYKGMTWVTHKDDDLGYSVDFPGSPLKTSIYGIPTWIFPDLATDNFYGIYVIRKGTQEHPADKQKVFNQVIKNLTDKKASQLISRKDVEINGLAGLDIVTKNNRQYQRSVMFVKNNMLYYLYLGNRLSILHTTYADRFFNSFKAIKVPEKAPANWIDFKSDTGAFTVKLPGQPETTVKEVANPKKPGVMVKLKLFIAVDTIGMTNYLVRYSDFATGNYMADKEVGLNALADELSANAKVIGKPKVIWLDGNEGRELRLIFGKSDHAVIRVYVRGNRTYMLLKENLREGEQVKTDDIFFNSFKLLPYISPTYVDYEVRDANFKIKLVEEPKVIKDTASDYTSFLNNRVFYAANNPMSDGAYAIEHYTLSKYYRTPGVDSLYKLLTTKLVKSSDTLVKLDTVMVSGKKAREVVTQNIETKDPKRIRVLLDGADVFYLECYPAKEELFSEQSNTFFTSFERTGDARQIDLASSKAKLIMDDLASTDTTVVKEAKGALDFYYFKNDELPEIYRALRKSYPDDTSKTGVRYRLLGKLNLIHDSGTSAQLQDLFANLESKDLLRSVVLRTIPNVDSVKGYDTYFKLLTETKPIKDKSNYTTFRPLYDSLEYTAAHFRELMPLTADSSYKDNIVTLASRMVSQDKPEYTKIIQENFDVLTNGAYDELVKYTTSTDTNKNEYDINTYKYLNIMGAVPGQPLTDTYTSYYLKHYPKGAFVVDAVTTRIVNGLPVSAKTVAVLLDSMDTRYQVMEVYHKQKQMDKVPFKYKTQSEFGRLCLYKDIASDNDDDNNYGDAEKLTLIGSVTDKGSIYYAYKFKQSVRDSVATFIGIAGPYKPGSTELPFDRYYAYTDYTVKGVNWMKQAKAMMPKLREAYDLDKNKGQTTSKK